ncbi:MAG: nucleotidyltransferase family protein, partial [Syntrophomonadaceae bacterium]|nr:nucleotidyltransferase family protein [Syntrophomonadaceae bacterium]
SIALRAYLNNPDLDSVLLGSNNILGIEYLRVLQEIKSDIIPLTIKRHGSTYHSKNISNYASATAIRHALYHNKSLQELENAIPSSTKRILDREIEQGKAPIDENAFNHMILTKLRTMDEKEIADLYEVTEGLESRIFEKSITSTNLEELKQEIKSKRYSLTRINRILLYSLFNLDKKTVDELDNCGPLYHHVLGFSEKGIKLLQEINQHSALPVLNRGKDVKALYDKKDTLAGKMISLEVMATNVYNLFFPNPNQRIGGSDFTTSPVKLL